MRAIRWILIAPFVVSPALAQQPQLGPGQLLGNNTASQRNAQATDLSSLIDRAFNNQQGSVFNRGPTVWAATRAPVLGLTGTAAGTLGFAGLTSGTMTISPQSVAGTGTLLLPNLAGTIVAGSASPLVANATTGVVSCPTCVTSTGGGAITGTGPISVSAAGVVSITSPLPLTNGGTNASLTAANGAIPYSSATALALLAPTATARLPMLSGANSAPVWGAFTLPAAVTSGGVACYTSATAQGSSALLTANALILGGGAGACPSPMASLGTTTTVLHGNPTGAPTFSQIVSGDIASNTIANSNLSQSGAATFKGNPTALTAAVQDFTIQGLAARGTPDSTNDKIVILDNAAGLFKYVTPAQIASSVTAGVSSLNGQTGNLAIWSPPQGRITLTSGAGVMTASVAAATTVYYTPYAGNQAPIYDGTNMVPTVFPELSISLGSSWTTNSNYDVFVVNDAGTVRACTGPAWSSDVVRGTGAGTTQLTPVNGLLLNAVAITCRYNNTTTVAVAASRGTYVGSFRVYVTAGQTNFIYGGTSNGGTAAMFGVWNAYNRVTFTTMVQDSTVSWTYNSASPIQLNNSNGNRASFMFGLAEDGPVANMNQPVNALSSSNVAGVGFGLDSTTAISGTGGEFGVATGSGVVPATLAPGPLLGWHFIHALQSSRAGTGTYYGNAAPTDIQGMTFQWRG